MKAKIHFNINMTSEVLDLYPEEDVELKAKFWCDNKYNLPAELLRDIKVVSVEEVKEDTNAK